MSVTDEIKARLDIVEYIQQYVPLKKAGRTYKACCPFHSERTPSFSVNPDRQSWRCFGACADGGDIFNFAMRYHGWDFKEALQQLGRQAGVEVTKQTPEQRARGDHLDKLRGMLETAATTYHKHLMDAPTDDAREVLAYAMQKRGLSEDTLRKFRIGYAPPGWQNMLNELVNLGYDEAALVESGLAIRNESGRVYDRFRNRLMIPICDERGKVNGFGARALDPDDNAKYINSPQSEVFDKSHLLFGLDQAKKTLRDGGLAVIVEGYMDAIQAHQAGFSNVVAQMGTALTETQLRLLVPRYANRIVLALDADAAGQSATRRSLETARQTLEADYAGRLSADIRILQIPGAKDPDDLLRESPDAWQALVDGALPVADYVIESETADLSAQATVQEREALARRILPILTASEKDLYTQDNVQKLARRLRIPERDLLAWAQEVKQAARNKPQRPAPQAPPPAAAAPGEPPPLDYDSMVPPPEFDDGDGLPVAPPTGGNGAVSGVQSFDGGRDTALEGYCLRMLCLQPDLYYQVNRRFRELAADDAELAKGALADLGAQDFVHSHHRELVNCLADAVKQTNRDVHDYMAHALDEDLQQYVMGLLINEEDGIRGRVGMQRFSSDLTRVILKEYERRVKPSIDPVAELVEKALVLRLRRLRRELDELVFVQRDAQEAGDYKAAAEYGMRIMLYNRAQTRLDEAVKKQRTLLIT